MPLILDDDEETSENGVKAETLTPEPSIDTPTEEVISRSPQEELAPETSQEDQSKPTRQGVILDDEQTPKQVEAEQMGLIGRFKKGMQQSAGGETSRWLNPIFDFFKSEKDEPTVKINKKQYKDPTFWESVVQSGGEAFGDTPYMAIGGALGAALGSVGGPTGAVIGGGAGAMMLPTFLKESMKEYRAFQDAGGDLSFGEFLERSARVGSQTLTQGAFGAILGPLTKHMNYLKKIPGIGALFDAKYVGKAARALEKPVKGAAVLGTEAGAATVVGAALDGRMPTQDDYSHALGLMLMLKSTGASYELTNKVVDYVKAPRSRNMNLALARAIESENLSYPAMNELNENKTNVYKNSKELDRNLAAFSESFVNRVTAQVEVLSPTAFESAHDAGVKLKGVLEQPGPMRPATMEPMPPMRTVRPLIRNPLQQAVESISPGTFETRTQGGRRIEQVYRRARQQAYEPLHERYDTLEREATGISFVDEGVVHELESFVSSWTDNASPSPQEAQLIRNAQNLLSDMQVRTATGEVTGIRPVQLNRVIKTIRSLKKIPDWNVNGDISHNMQEVINFTEDAVVRHLSDSSPALGTEYNALRADYRDFKVRFDNPNMNVFNKPSTHGAKVYDNFTSIDSFSDLRNAIGGSPEGSLTLARFSRNIWEKKLGRDILRASTENQFAEGLGKIEGLQFNELMEYLTPEQQLDVFHRVQEANYMRQAVEANELAYEASLRDYKARQRLDKVNKAVRDFNANEAKDIQSKQGLLTSILGEDPASLTRNMNTIEGIKRTRENLKGVAGGSEMFEALKRFETERMFDFMGEGFVRDGRVPFSEFEAQMRNKEFRAKLKELNGQEFVHQMDRLAEVSGNLSQAYKKSKILYRNDPHTYQSIINIGLALGVATDGLLSAGAAFAYKTAAGKGMKATQSFWNRRNYDQAHIKKAVDAAKALESKNASKINQTSKSLFDFTGS